MRNLAAGNKVNFSIFIFLVFVILLIIVVAVSNVLKKEKEKYTISSTACNYDKNYNYIELENDGIISKKWNGNYYLKENDTNNEYQLGKYAVSFDKNRKSLDLFGTFYQVLEGGDVLKITEHNGINNTSQNRFYKIEDRKYLIIAKTINNNTGSLSTENYLIVILDKSGNALLLNNKINAKTINEMIISTDSFNFDVANEILNYNDEQINLKKIIGSTNLYTQKEEEIPEENVIEENETMIAEQNNTGLQFETVASSTTATTITTTTDQASTTATTTTSTSTTTSTTNNKSETIIQNKAKDEKEDNSWIESLNEWVGSVAEGFQNIFKKSSSNKEEGQLSKNIALNSLSAGTTFIDINYTITDPENKYNIVYAIISNDTDTQTISLNKEASTYRLTNLNPDTNYVVELGYKIIYSDSNVEEVTEDTMMIRTSIPKENLKITKVSLDKVYYTLKLDNNFVYDDGCKLVIYLKDDEIYDTIILKSGEIEKAASSGYNGSFTIPRGYKTLGGEIRIKLEDTKVNGNTIQTNLMAKIVNY